MNYMQFNGKILIVDDEPHIRKFFSLMLKSVGNPTIIEAGNGSEALALYDRHQPELVFMDINMPVMDGLESLERLVIRHPEARVIMLTSMATRSAVQQSIDHGAVDFLRKDIPRDAVAETLAAVILKHLPGVADVPVEAIRSAHAA